MQESRGHGEGAIWGRGQLEERRPGDGRDSRDSFAFRVQPHLTPRTQTHTHARARALHDPSLATRETTSRLGDAYAECRGFDRGLGTDLQTKVDVNSPPVQPVRDARAGRCVCVCLRLERGGYTCFLLAMREKEGCSHRILTRGKADRTAECPSPTNNSRCSLARSVKQSENQSINQSINQRA